RRGTSPDNPEPGRLSRPGFWTLPPSEPVRDRVLPPARGFRRGADVLRARGRGGRMAPQGTAPPRRRLLRVPVADRGVAPASRRGRLDPRVRVPGVGTRDSPPAV